jgi:capsid protein
MVRSAAVGINVSYGFLARDHSDSNFSAARQEYLEDLKHWRPRQRFLVQHLCEPVYREWYRLAQLTGQVRGLENLPLEEVHLRWRTPGWDWVDPKVEVEADILAITAGLKSPQEASMERGRDFYETVDQLAEARLYAEEAGLKTLTIFPPEIVPAEDSEDSEDSDASAEKDSSDGKAEQLPKSGTPTGRKPFAAA